MLCAMRLLFTVLTDSLIIWSRNFTLVYIFLFCLFLFEQIVPQGVLPAWTWQWLLLFLTLLLVMAAIMAGWFNMVATACCRFLEKPREQALSANTPITAFLLYKEFFPGIARFFPSIAIGTILQGGLALLFFSAIRPWWQENLPVLERLLQTTLENREAVRASLSFSQQASLGELFLVILAGMFIYACISLLFILWPVFIIYYADSPLKAYWRALTQYVKDPLHMLPLSGTFLAGGIAMYIVTGLSVLAGPIVFLLLQLCMLLGMVFGVIVMFVYVYYAVGKPLVPLKEDTESPIAH
jgi:hypothetical protein